MTVYRDLKWLRTVGHPDECWHGDCDLCDRFFLASTEIAAQESLDLHSREAHPE
jgi:hypothetical protein